MTIKAIVAKKRETGEVLFAQGVEDGYSDVQVVVPKSLFTENDIKKMYTHTQARFDKCETALFCLGETQAHDAERDYDNFSVKMVEIEITRDMV